MNQKNPFSVEIRAVSLYDRLHRDFSAKSDEILNSLPQFVRMGLIESKEAWSKFVNKYDLLTLVSTSKSLEDLSDIIGVFSISKRITPDKTDIQYLEEKDFRSIKIIKTRDKAFSVQDFVLSIGYHGTFHLEANERPELEFLYREFISKEITKSTQLTLEISEVLLNSFKEIRDKLAGNNNAYCDINSRQPMIVKAGELIKFTNQGVAQRFDNSFMQIPIRGQTSRGVRICLDVELLSPIEAGYIFSYGNRRTRDFISLSYNSGALVVTSMISGKRENIITYKISNFVNKKSHIEVCLYPTGEMLLSIDGNIESIKIFANRFELFDGKLMIGSDLSGKNAGFFLNSCLSVEAVSPQGKLYDVFLAGLKHLKSNEGIKLMPDTNNRVCLM